jgi:hypothetical protein
MSNETTLTHPGSTGTVKTSNPEAYLSQGWVEKTAAKGDESKPEGK